MTKTEKLNVWIDGACEPVNPGGTASYGLVVKVGDKTVHTESGILGSGKLMSNNVAEYCALIMFLKWNKDNKPAIIHSDSLMLVNQMEGLFQVR